MSETPPPPPQPALVSAGAIPWERRRDLGFLPAILETLRESLLAPTPFFRKLDPRGSIPVALGYGLLIWMVALGCGIFWQVVLPGPWGGELPIPVPIRSREDLVNRLAGIGVLAGLVIVMLVILGPVLYAAVTLLYSGVLHVVLLIVGGPSRGYAGTARVVAYSAGPQLLTVVPFCGGLAAWIWSSVLQVIGLREVHGVPTGKAVAVVVIPFMLCAAALAGVILVVLLAAGGAAALRSL